MLNSKNKRMNKRDNNLRNAVDNVFRQTSPPTPPRVVQEVLSSTEDSDNTSVSSTTVPQVPAPRQTGTAASMLTRPETSLTLPAPDVTPIIVDSIISKQPTGINVWNIILVLAFLVAIGLLLYYNITPIRNWVDGSFATKPVTAPQQNNTTVRVQPIVLPNTVQVKQVPQPGQDVKKTVRFDETKNTIQMIDTNAPPKQITASMAAQIASVTDGSNTFMTPPFVSTTVPTATTANDSNEIMQQLARSLDHLAKTSMDLQAQRDTAISNTSQKQDGSLLRLDERAQFSKSEQLANAPINQEEMTNAVQSIYDRSGGNSVVGNRLKAPFVTFAPGEEPFDGMIPDYDEANSADMPPTLKSGEQHSMMELISDHCMRTGKPQPKPADKSTLDVMSRKDTSSLAPMRAADCDGHYLQSQKKQFELQRLNQSAAKKIYDAKHASATGQILDRGQTTLTSFAASRDDDAAQYLNVNSL